MTSHTDNISVARDFSKNPGLRYKRISKYSGEEFRDTLLTPAARAGHRLVVDLDGVRGYGSSFLEEAFGGLIREMQWSSLEIVNEHLEIKATDEGIRNEVHEYIADAVQQIKNSQ